MQPTILGDFVDDLSRSREPGGVRGEARRPGLARPRGRAGALARSILRPSAGEPKAGCASRRPPESLRPAPCEPPAPGQNRPAGLPVALARAVAPARHAAAAFLVVFAALLAVSTTAQAQTTGICGRTAAVRTAILGKISGVSNCANVTDTHLAAITGGTGTLNPGQQGQHPPRGGGFRRADRTGGSWIWTAKLSDLASRRGVRRADRADVRLRSVQQRADHAARQTCSTG